MTNPFFYGKTSYQNKLQIISAQNEYRDFPQADKCPSQRMRKEHFQLILNQQEN